MPRRAWPVLILLVAGCARSEDASVVPTNASENGQAVEQVRPDRDVDEPALGQWREALQGEQRVLEFGPLGAPPLFSFGCDARRGLLIQRHGLESSGDLPVMLITLGSETRRLAVTSGDGPIPMLRASVSETDPLVASLERAPQPITVRIGDSPPLILPAGEEVGAYVTRCSGGELASAALSATSNGTAEANASASNAAAATD